MEVKSLAGNNYRLKVTRAVVQLGRDGLERILTRVCTYLQIFELYGQNHENVPTPSQLYTK